MTRKSFFILLLLGLLFQVTHGQELVSSSGDSYQAGNYTISWSAGEAVTTTAGGTGHTLTQGYHQPDLVVTALDQDFLEKNNIALQVYPNPTDQYLVIDFSSASDFKNLTLYGIRGNKLDEWEITGESVILDMSAYESGIYLLRISDTNNEYEINKIIKN